MFEFRSYDSAIGRFTGVDPIADEFAHVSGFNYAENTPIMAIDLYGLQAFFVHGTMSNPKRWNKNIVPILMKLTNNKTPNSGFSWKNESIFRKNGTAWYGNGEYDRKIAAKKLMKYVLKNRINGEEITLIGHSHGGNVALQAAQMIYEKIGEKANVITIATPAYKGENDPENPNNIEGINDHIHIYNDRDRVQQNIALVGNDDKYPILNYNFSDKTRNEKIDVSLFYPKKSIDAHSFDSEHPELIQNANIEKLQPVERK